MARNIKKARRKKINENGRLKVILAIVFIMSLAIIIKLFTLQSSNYKLYVALASDQHQVFSKLEPERGKIFISDRQDGSFEKNYPVATNKEFALVYAIPKKIENADKIAADLYEILDRERIAEEVDKKIDKEFANRIKYLSDYEADITNDNTTSGNVKANELEDFKNVKKELEIELRRKKIINEYLEKLSKKDDPYEPIKYKVNEEMLDRLLATNLAGIDFIKQKDRYYPEPELGGHLLGFVGYQNEIKVGQYGLEGYFNEELTGRPGSIKAERSASGELIILNDREYNKPVNGSDIILTINRSIQYAVCTKLKAAVKRHGADGGSVLVLEPRTGAILAMCSEPDYDPNAYSSAENINVYNNPAIFSQYEPGSIFKIMTMAASMDYGAIKPETTYVDKGSVMIEGWPKPIKNSDFEKKGGRGIVDMITVLEESLNTGVIFAMQKIGADIFADYVKKFGFGEKTGIELETESGGSIKSLLAKKIRPIEAATASFGQGLTVTPLQIANAYAAIANNGILMKPYLVKEIINDDGEKTVTQPREIRRVISERTASLIGGLLVKVVENGHGKRAKVDGYYIGGKTGTAQVPKKGGGYEENAHIGSFVGFGPIEDPVFVMLVKIDNPRDVEWAESSAAPLFGEIAQFILNYYQVPKTR